MTTIAQKCQAAGIALPTYYFRIKNGMTPEEALSTPNKRRQPQAHNAPLPEPEPEDQEPRASVMIKDGGKFSYVFEGDFQKAEKKKRQKRADDTKAKLQRDAEELGGSYHITPNKKPQAPALATSPDYEKVDNYEYQSRKPLRYGPTITASKKEPCIGHWCNADEEKFNRACGGYTAVILNHVKDCEFKYQIYSTNTKKKLYTNDIVRFINQIIKICDPEGKTPFRVIER